jgi:hypothetical protein
MGWAFKVWPIFLSAFQKKGFREKLVVDNTDEEKMVAHPDLK